MILVAVVWGVVPYLAGPVAAQVETQPYGEIKDEDWYETVQQGGPVVSEPIATEPTGGVQRAVEGWKMSFAPYLWASATDGELSINGNRIAPDQEIKDSLQDFQGSYGYSFEARRHDGLILFHELQFLEFEEDEAEVKSTPGGGGPDTAKLELERVSLSLAVGRRLLDQKADAEGSAGDVRAAFDVFLGARLHHLSTDIRLAGTQFDDSRGWVHPMVGARYIQEISNWSDINIMGYVAGFDRADNWSVSVSAVYDIHVKEGFDVFVGYRHTKVKHDNDGGFDYDMTSAGPILGGRFHF